MQRFFSCVAFGAVLTLLCSGSRAQPAAPRVALQWGSQEGCLDRPQLVAAVSAAAPTSLLVDTDADAEILGRAEQASDGSWSIAITVVDAKGKLLGERDLHVAEAGCQALVEHVVLVTAMLVDSAMVRAASETKSGAQEHDDGPGSSRLQPVDDPQNPLYRQALPVTTVPRLRISLGPGVELGRLPSASLGMRLGGAWRFAGGIEWALAAYAFPEVVVSVAEGEEMALRWRGLASAICVPTATLAAFELRACGGARIGEMRAQGRGFVVDERQRELVADLDVEVIASRALVGRLYLAASLGALAALRRPQFGYESETGSFEPVHAPPLFGAGAQIALGLRFL